MSIEHQYYPFCNFMKKGEGLRELISTFSSTQPYPLLVLNKLEIGGRDFSFGCLLLKFRLGSVFNGIPRRANA